MKDLKDLKAKFTKFSQFGIHQKNADEVKSSFVPMPTMRKNFSSKFSNFDPDYDLDKKIDYIKNINRQMPPEHCSKF